MYVQEQDYPLTHCMLTENRKTPFAWSATKALCKYFYHEIKIHKNIIDDCQEQIRTQRAIVKHLENDCKIHDTIDNAQQKIKMLDLLAEGCKSKKNRCMAENRRLRARTPGERHGIVFEDEYEDDGEVIEINDDTYERPEEHAIPRLRRACWPLSR